MGNGASCARCGAPHCRDDWVVRGRRPLVEERHRKMRRAGAEFPGALGTDVRRIQAALPRESLGSRFPDRRAIGTFTPASRSWFPARRRGDTVGQCSRCCSHFAPAFLGEPGPFCPICFELRVGIALSLHQQYSTKEKLRQGDFP